MSLKLNIETLSEKERLFILENLRADMGPCKKSLFPYEIIDTDYIVIPFNFAVERMMKLPPPRSCFLPSNVKFNGVLYEDQTLIIKDGLNKLSKTGSLVLACAVAIGKTIMSIYLSSKIKLKTLIIVNKIVLINQWIEAIHMFIDDAKIQKLTPKIDIDYSNDFFLINAVNLPKFTNEQLKNIGFLIVDELHLIFSAGASEGFKRVCPRYFLGLSATPFRLDNCDTLINLYLNPDRIIKRLYKKHIVYKVETNFVPTIEISKKTNKINWGLLLETQSNDIDRNNIILKIILSFKDRNFLVLCKRISQANFLIDKLEDYKQSYTSLIGTKQHFDTNARILVAIYSKCSTGFNFPKLNALILAADIDSYFIQVLGRIMRCREAEQDPIVFDLVDNNGILKKHFSNRCEIYTSCGGIIKNLKHIQPDFYNL